MKMPSLVTRVLRRFGFEPLRQKRSVFMGALASRLTSDWQAFQQGPTFELSGALGVLRQRARDLERNHPLVRRYLHLVAENVVGHRGIRLQARNETSPGKQNDQANKAIEAAWAEWGRPEHCTIEGATSWAGFQQLVAKTVARDGECFVRIVQKVNDYGFGLQILDADLIDEFYTRGPDEHGTTIRLGVEVDKWGRPLAYHTYTRFLNDLTASSDKTRQRIPASEVIHLFIPRRPLQTRGESWLAPVMLSLRHLDGYTEAELVAARTCAAKMGFITPDAEGGGGVDPDTEPSRKDMDASPGSIDQLAPGDTFTPWDPQHPSMNFATFVTQIEKIIAGGLNVAYASLSGDLREVNYSSIRAGLLQERDGWRSLQTWIADHLCEPVYRRWRDVAWRSGRLSLRMAPSEYNDHVWQPRGWAWIDPQKDVMASALAVAFGFTSPQRVVGEDGEDFEEIQRERQQAEALLEELDLKLMLPQGAVDGEAGQAGTTDANADGGSGSTGNAQGGGRAHPPLAVVRSAR